MDSVNQVWEMVIGLISEHLTETAFNTWFADCTAIELGENQLVLHTTSPVKRDIIKNRYGNLIVQAQGKDEYVGTYADVHIEASGNWILKGKII